MCTNWAQESEDAGCASKNGQTSLAHALIEPIALCDVQGTGSACKPSKGSGIKGDPLTPPERLWLYRTQRTHQYHGDRLRSDALPSCKIPVNYQNGGLRRHRGILGARTGCHVAVVVPRSPSVLHSNKTQGRSAKGRLRMFECDCIVFNHEAPEFLRYPFATYCQHMLSFSRFANPPMSSR